MKKNDFMYMRFCDKALYKVKTEEGFNKACTSSMLRKDINEDTGTFQGPGIYMIESGSFPLDGISKKNVLYLSKCTEEQLKKLKQVVKDNSVFLSNKDLR